MSTPIDNRETIKYIKKSLPALVLLLLIVLLTSLFVTRYFYRSHFLEESKKQLKDSMTMISKMISSSRFPIDVVCGMIPHGNQVKFSMISLDSRRFCDELGVQELTSREFNRPVVQQAIKHDFVVMEIEKFKSIDGYLASAIKISEGGEVRILVGNLSLKGLDTTFNTLGATIFILLFPVFLLLSIFLTWEGFIRGEVVRKRSEKLKEDLIANISHEVRTPLTSLKGYAQFLKSESHQFSDTVQDYFLRIEQNTSRLDRLFKDVLDLSVLENEGKLDFEPIIIEDLMDQISRNLIENYKDKNITYTVQNNIDIVYAEPKSIYHVVNNLIENAFKHTNAGCNIDVKWDKFDANRVLLTVSDNGDGIREKDLPRIFERFYRGDSSRSRSKGTGLGLAIVKHAVNNNNGKIWVESKIGKGTTFYVRLLSR